MMLQQASQQLFARAPVVKRSTLAALGFSAALWAYCHAAFAAPETISVIAAPPPAVTAAPSGVSTRLDALDFQALPYDRLDDVLAAKTGFSLFRRIPSLTANPTTQGASLRGIGPNGAGRAGVLLDGAPLNDPFGNWVNWTSILPGTIASATVLHGGRPLAGGPGALSGLIAAETGTAQAGLTLRADANTLEGGDASAIFADQVGAFGVIAFAGGGQRNGYIPIIESQRGPADVAARSYNISGGVKVARGFGPHWRGAVSLRGFSEGRDNGIEDARNDTQGFDGSIRFVRDRASGPNADISAYGQVRRFASLFTATDAQRETSRPVLDQFSVPSYAFGARANLSQQWSERHQSNLYLDAAWRSGETNERFRNLGAGFTRQRTAGGKQSNFGAGLQHRIAVSETLSLDGGARLDVLRLRQGRRIETNLATNAVVRDDALDNRSDTIVSGSAGLRYQPAPAIIVKARGYTGSRQPSLNEYFRPFRVGNDITEANPMLDIETLRGLDVSVRYEPLTGQFFQITVFRNWLRDAVANLSVAGQAGGFIAPCGFVPTGGSCRQRGNVERARASGVEAIAGATLHQQVSVTIFYGYTQAKIRRSSINAALEGTRFAQVPRHQGSIDVRWTMPTPKLSGSIVLRAQSDQFEDDLNSRTLNGFAAVDLGLRWQVSNSLTARLDAINVSDTQIDAGKSADGLTTRGQPFTARVGLTATF